MSVILALDTTGRGGAAVIARDTEILGQAVHDSARGYAEHLFGLIDTALERAQLGADAISRVGVVSGPGSFTGLRIGVMTAKTLAYARGWELVAAGTLPLLGTAVDSPGWAIVDGGAGQLWVQRIADTADADAASIDRIDPAELSVATWDQVVTADPELAAGLRERVSWADALVECESLGILLARAMMRADTVVETVDPLAFVPEYVSPSQAERAHGLDLRDEVNRPIRPRDWS